MDLKIRTFGRWIAIASALAVSGCAVYGDPYPSQVSAGYYVESPARVVAPYRYDVYRPYYYTPRYRSAPIYVTPRRPVIVSRPHYDDHRREWRSDDDRRHPHWQPDGRRHEERRGDDRRHVDRRRDDDHRPDRLVPRRDARPDGGSRERPHSEHVPHPRAGAIPRSDDAERPALRARPRRNEGVPRAGQIGQVRQQAAQERRAQQRSDANDRAPRTGGTRRGATRHR